MTVYSLQEPTQNNVFDIFNVYEASSGHKINYDKLEASFRKVVCMFMQEEFIGFLKMWKVDEHTKYLSIQTIIARSKRPISSTLKGRIWKKL